VNGEIIVENGNLLTLDEGTLVKRVQETTERVWNRIPNHHYLGKNSDEVSPQSFKKWCPE
jgi:hypothetical protein